MLGNCRYAFGEVGLFSGLVQRSRVSDAMCPASSLYCQYMSGDVGFVSGLVRQCMFYVVICPALSASCRDLFVEVVLLSGLLRRGRLSVGKFSERLV